MSRRENNLKRMKAAKRLRQKERLVARTITAVKSDHDEIDDDNVKGSPSAVIVDKFTGEVREGGADVIKEFFSNIRKEREQCIASTNPCYLVGKVKQNEAHFKLAEIRTMIDTTFECACCCCLDAWYPNQYALALAFEEENTDTSQLLYFLSNFELGLRISGQRATRQLGKNGWLREADLLAARLNSADAMHELSPSDIVELKKYVKRHPHFQQAMAWYEQVSGKRMMQVRRGGMAASASSKMASFLEEAVKEDRKVIIATHDGHRPEWSAAKGKKDTLADIEIWKDLVRQLGREKVIDDLMHGNICTWLGSDSSHKLFIKAGNEVEGRKLLRFYTDSDLAEWFSLMTSLALVEAMLQTGMLWKQLGKDNPAILPKLRSLQKLRQVFKLA